MALLTITVHKAVNEYYYFRLRNIGNQLLLTSRNYSSLRKCLNDIYSLQVHRDFQLINELHADCMHYSFSLKTAFGSTIACSPLYYSSQQMKGDMQLITSTIHEAEVEDNSTQVRFFRTVNSKI
jgi:uncharacterized protein YegP (UPF0339 family)